MCNEYIAFSLSCMLFCFQDGKNYNTAISTSAEQSVDAAGLEDFSSRPEKQRDSKNVRDRYRIIRQQFAFVPVYYL